MVAVVAVAVAEVPVQWADDEKAQVAFVPTAQMRSPAGRRLVDLVGVVAVALVDWVAGGRADSGLVV